MRIKYRKCLSCGQKLHIICPACGGDLWFRDTILGGGLYYDQYRCKKCRKRFVRDRIKNPNSLRLLEKGIVDKYLW